MKHLRGYEKFKESRKISENLNPVNEEILGKLFGGLKELFGKVWDQAVAGMKKELGKNPEPEKIKGYLDQNILDPNKPTFIFKAVVGKDSPFFKAPTANDQSCLELIGKMLDPVSGGLGSGPEGGLQQLYDDLLKNFGKETPTLDIVKYYLETIRNRAIKDYKYAKGPDLKVGKPAVINPKDINFTLADLTHLPDLKKILTTAKDEKAKRQVTLDWVNKTFLVRLDKYLSEIKNEDVDKYIESVGKEVPEAGPEGGYKVGDDVLYKREKFDQAKWDALTDDDKKKTEEGKVKELLVAGIVGGIKKISKIEGDKVSFEGADFTKTMGDILMKVATKAEGQDDLVTTLKDVKTKNPEAIKKLDNIAKIYQEPDKNKDKIAEIDKLIGGEEEGK
jgi:hypothetical protein